MKCEEFRKLIDTDPLKATSSEVIAMTVHANACCECNELLTEIIDSTEMTVRERYRSKKEIIDVICDRTEAALAIDPELQSIVKDMKDLR